MVAKKDLYPNQLSGGQQQLVGIARALVANPKMILADEPTGNLHSSQAKEIMETFKRLNEEGVTIIQVTHSEKNAEYGNRVIQIVDGWIENPVATRGRKPGLGESSMRFASSSRARFAAGPGAAAPSDGAISNGMVLSLAAHSSRFAGSTETCAQWPQPRVRSRWLRRLTDEETASSVQVQLMRHENGVDDL